MITAAGSAGSGGGQPWWLGLITNPFFWVGLLLAVWVVLRLRSLYRLRLCFSEFAGGDDAAAGQLPASVLRALIRVEVHRLAAIAQMPDGRPLRFDMAGPYDDQCDLGSVSDGLPPGWKQVVAILGLLISQLGSRARVVTGMLLPRERIVLGIETIHGGVARTEMIGLQGLSFPDPQDVLGNLALPAAGWIILAGYPGATLGGTPNWGSFTAFAVGFAWQQAGRANLSQARSFYTQACEDPRNMAAAINLAALEQVDERHDPAAPADPLGRQSAQRLLHVAEVTGSQVSEDRPEDLQWYRSRYLLSSDLRDNVDARRASAGQTDGQTDDEAATSAVAQEALNYAVELAIRMEVKRDVLPPDFVQCGRAAALTLVARQAFPVVTGENADELAIAPEGNSNVTDSTPLSDLLELKNGTPKPGVAERLVQYARTRCLTDDQTDYNVMQYQGTKARIIRVAFERWSEVRSDAERQLVIRNPDPRLADQVIQWLDKVQRWQEMLAEQYELAELDQEESRARVVEAGDPVLVGLLDRRGDLLYYGADGDNQRSGDDFEFRSRVRAFPRTREPISSVGTARLERPEEKPAFLAELRTEGPVTPDVARQEEASVVGGGRPGQPAASSADRRAGQLVPQEPKPPARWRQWLGRLTGRNSS